MSNGIPAEASRARRVTALFIGIVGGAAVFCAALVPYGILGIMTGQIAMCGWGPEWWTYVYLSLSLVVFAIAGISGRALYRVALDWGRDDESPSANTAPETTPSDQAPL